MAPHQRINWGSMAARRRARAVRSDDQPGLPLTATPKKRDLLALALDRGFRLAELLGEKRGMSRRWSRRPPADRQRRAAAAAKFLTNFDRGAAGETPHGQFGAAVRAEATVGLVVVVTSRTAHEVNSRSSRALCPSDRHSTDTRAEAPLFLIKTTTNFAGLVLLAFRPMTWDPHRRFVLVSG